jgi:hypothetical protein
LDILCGHANYFLRRADARTKLSRVLSGLVVEVHQLYRRGRKETLDFSTKIDPKFTTKARLTGDLIRHTVDPELLDNLMFPALPARAKWAIGEKTCEISFYPSVEPCWHCCC